MRGAKVVGLVVVALLVGCGRGSAVADGAVGTATPLPAGVIVAQYAYGSGDTGGGHGTFLSLFDEQSGRHLRDLVYLDEGSAWDLAGFSRTTDGSVVYALAHRPFYRGNVAHPSPEAGSCGGNVYQLSAVTGQVRSLFTVGADSTIQEPAVSPDGTSVAYLSRPCTAAADQVVVVRDLSTGRERRVSVSLASATHVSWRSDEAELVVTVSLPRQQGGADASGYVVVPTGADGPQPREAVRQSPDHGCLVEDAAFVGAVSSADLGIVLAEGCPDRVTAPARLVQIRDSGPDLGWRADTRLCPNGMTLAVEPRGRLLVTATATCGGADAPVDVVQIWTGEHRTEVGHYGNPAQFVSNAA